MARKRKAPSTSTPTSTGAGTPSEESYVRPEVILRRSSRRATGRTHNEEEAKTRDAQEARLGSNTPSKKETPEMERRRIADAIEGLKVLEKKFEEDTRINKLRLRRNTPPSISNPPDATDIKTVVSNAMGAQNDWQWTPQTNSSRSAAPYSRGDHERVRKWAEASQPVLSSVAEDNSDYGDAMEAVPRGEVAEVTDRGARRAPPVNSGYLPLPWMGRLGYACLNTYLRAAKPSVFCSRTCRIESILKHRHPLRDPSQREHPKHNPPDPNQKAFVELGLKFVQDIGLANARDIPKILRWNDKYNIKFFRLSSEMFPFASHPEHGYKLAPFASEVLAEAGRVAGELGHRLTTHPGQFTQLGSPHKKVIDAAVRDLEYHDEMLTLLRLPPQQNRDAVMVIHMGGTYEGKLETLARFRQSYSRLSTSIKDRLVLENDDVSWSVHDLLPICEELNIPLVLDYHHHNIVFDASQCREGTFDISEPYIMNRIAATWTRKGIRQKMHYSEPCPGAVTARDRRKHSPRVATLPPCPNDMDLMIEAKDKEQAVFELMRNFKLPGHHKIRDMIPHERGDENPVVSRQAAKKTRSGARAGAGAKRKAVEYDDEDDDGYDDSTDTASAEDFDMGGAEGGVYWPPGREDWLKAVPRAAAGNKKKGKQQAIAAAAVDEDEDVNMDDSSCGE